MRGDWIPSVWIKPDGGSLFCKNCGKSATIGSFEHTKIFKKPICPYCNNIMTKRKKRK